MILRATSLTSLSRTVCVILQCRGTSQTLPYPLKLLCVITAGLTLCGTSACNATHAAYQTVRPPQSSCVPDTAQSNSDVAVVDTEETLEPDTLRRSWDRMYVVRRRILQFAQRQGTLPTQLSEIMYSDDFINYACDAWNSPLHYVTRASRFEVRSAGPDRRLGSVDDLYADPDSISRRP